MDSHKVKSIGNVARSAAMHAIRLNPCVIHALLAHSIQIADILLRQDLLAKNVLMTAQRKI